MPQHHHEFIKSKLHDAMRLQEIKYLQTIDRRQAEVRQAGKPVAAAQQLQDDATPAQWSLSGGKVVHVITRAIARCGSNQHEGSCAGTAGVPKSSNVCSPYNPCIGQIMRVGADMTCLCTCCRAKELADIYDRLSGKLSTDERLNALMHARVVLKAAGGEGGSTEALELVNRELDLLKRCFAAIWDFNPDMHAESILPHSQLCR